MCEPLWVPLTFPILGFSKGGVPRGPSTITFAMQNSFSQKSKQVKVNLLGVSIFLLVHAHK